MFGADTPLVMDAIQIAGLAAAAAAAAVWFIQRRRKGGGSKPDASKGPGELEQRVRVLERIATDRSADLAEEIEDLRRTERVE